jgi:hypothetical protein
MSRARSRRREKARRGPQEPVPGVGTPAIPHHWLKIGALALAAICLLGWFANEAQDTDFWWHLKTGQYIVQHHSLPVPDPFAYTTSIVAPKHPNEELVRHFNLTHEWLAQALMYIVYLIGGFPLIILVRAALLGGMCALAGFLAARLSKNFYLGIAAAFAAASLAIEFRADRPALVTFLFVAVFVTILELRFALWALPPLALIWANCHGGFFLGWVVLLAYCVETLPLGKWLRRAGDARRLWLVTICTIGASLINPNGIAVVRTLIEYRKSPMTADLLEWHPPYLWGPPYAFDILLYISVLALLVSWKRVRPAHWALFIALAGASLTAFRNIPMIAFLAPVMIGVYLVPLIERLIPKVAPFFRRAIPWATPLVLATAIVVGVFQDWFFQLRVAAWTTPAGAADFLIANHITGRMFNTWAQGGYLIWRLWPQERVFIDGRAMSESLNRDYQQILNNLPGPIDKLTGPRKDLMDRYGIQVVAMNTIEFVSGGIYPLAVALGTPESTEWQLVYDDPQALVFVRNPPPGTPVLPDKIGRVLVHMDTECEAYIEHSPGTPNCGLSLFDFWMRSKQQDRAVRMLQLYLAHTPERNPQAEEWWRRLTGGPVPKR